MHVTATGGEEEESDGESATSSLSSLSDVGPASRTLTSKNKKCRTEDHEDDQGRSGVPGFSRDDSDDERRGSSDGDDNEGDDAKHKIQVKYSEVKVIGRKYASTKHKAHVPQSAGIKVVVIMEDSERAMPLIAHLVLMGADVTVWDAAGAVIDSEGPGPDLSALYFCRTSPSSRMRGRAWAPAASLRVVEWLEHHGATVLNGSRALQLEFCKWRQVQTLRSLGLETPRTCLVASAPSVTVDVAKGILGERGQMRAAKPREAAMEAWEAWWVKPAHGGSGVGAARFEELAAIDRMLLKEPDSAKTVFREAPDNLLLLQKEGARPSRGARVGGRLRFTRTFYRAEFLGDRLLYLLKVTAINTSVSACPCDKRTNGDVVYEIVAPPSARHWNLFSTRCIQYMRSSGMVVAAFEYLVPAPGRYLIIDVNANTNYGAEHERRAGVECGYKSLARALVQRASDMALGHDPRRQSAGGE